MKKRGFTLIEMIAVILIMALLTLIILPTIINQIRSQKENISGTAMQLISNATELYLSENEYSMRYGETYCISLETLVNDGKLKSPLKDLSTGKEIPLNQVVKTVINEYGSGEYSLVDTNQCKAELLSTPEWQEKSFEDDKVILTYGLDQENTVKETKCYYGKTSDNITSLGNSEDHRCVYPSEAAYAKVCIINDKEIESCSQAKKLADYLILDGNMLVDFDTHDINITQNDGYLNLYFETYGRRGLYAVQPIDFTKYSYAYVDIDASLWVPEDYTGTNANPHLLFAIKKDIESAFSSGSNFLSLNSKSIIYATSESAGWTQTTERKNYQLDTTSIEELAYVIILRSASITVGNSNIYNVWLQLSE